MNIKDKTDFLNDKPKHCQYEDCKNKVYAKNKLTPIVYEWVCFKHYNECCRGILK